MIDKTKLAKVGDEEAPDKIEIAVRAEAPHLLYRKRFVRVEARNVLLYRIELGLDKTHNWRRKKTKEVEAWKAEKLFDTSRIYVTYSHCPLFMILQKFISA